MIHLKHARHPSPSSSNGGHTKGLPSKPQPQACPAWHFGGAVPPSMDGTRQPASLSIVPMLARRAVPPPTTNSPSSGLATCQYLGASTRSHMFRQANLDTRKQYGRREESALSAEPSRRVSSSAAPAQTSNDNNNNNNYPFDMRKPLPTHWQFQPYIAHQTTTTNNARYHTGLEYSLTTVVHTANLDIDSVSGNCPLD